GGLVDFADRAVDRLDAEPGQVALCPGCLAVDPNIHARHQTPPLVGSGCATIDRRPLRSQTSPSNPLHTSQGEVDWSLGSARLRFKSNRSLFSRRPQARSAGCELPTLWPRAGCG